MAKELEKNEELIQIPTPDASSDKYLSAIVRHPLALDEDAYKNGLEHATHRLAIMMHGIGSSKDFCFSRRLAKGLSDKQGVWSVRFDFRNCGDSSRNGKQGRTVEEDIEDVEAVYQYFKQGKHQGTRFVIDIMVGHSRGVVDMFKWAMKYNDPEHYVPMMVAAAGRWFGYMYTERTRENYPNFEEDGGHYEYGILGGERRLIWIPKEETFDLASQNMEEISKLNPNTDTLCIYGTKETVVWLPSSSYYSNALSPRNKTVLIEGANHSFYGDEKVTAEEAADKGLDYSERRGTIDYNQQVADAILDFTEHKSARARFYRRTQKIHRFLPRWKQVDRVANFRDIGGYMVPTSGKHVRYNVAYRCADPTHISDDGLAEVKRLGIKTVFDLRSDTERAAGALEAEGIENIHVSLFGDDSLAPQDMLKSSSMLLVSWSAYLEVYAELLRRGAEKFHVIFSHIRDHPGEGFVFHCTAGKDRTGILGMLILRLLGVPPTIVAREYELTETGLMPARAHIAGMFLGWLNACSEDEINELRRAVSMERVGWSVEKEGLDNILSARYDAMIETMHYIDTEYGGIEGYLMNEVGLTGTDLAQIRDSLLVE